jgi:hypothetical protein
MRAITGPPAKMKMENEMKFESLGPGRTKVTCVVEYHVSYPLIGPLLDRFYLRKRAQTHAENAVRGMQGAANRRAIPPTRTQFEKRVLDHPGYKPPGSLG